jgi:CubicO group peptidase (beta-lactamase class C family)
MERGMKTDLFIALMVFLGLSPATVRGQTTVAAASSQKTIEQHIELVESCLPPQVIVKNEPKTCPTLAQRMTELHIPGVSIAVIHDGKIEWAKGYGILQTGGAPVNSDTLFQAGSISKPVAAMGTLRLVQEGKLSLDVDINKGLTSWKLPPSTAAPGATVTLRELLTHSAGLTVHGFSGYAAGAPVPTLVQVLDGEAPANSEPIRMDSVPGKDWRYSGGGYTVMQQLVIDTVKEPFPQFLHDIVLVPIGISHSTYQQPLPESRLSNAAKPYNGDGTAVPGGPHTYPEMAAAGLWTTTSDLCRYIIEVQNSLSGKANHVLSQSMTQQMLTPGVGNWGLGLQLGGSSTDPWFSHGGSNAGYESLFVGYDRHGDGAAVMTNAQGGSRLAGEVMSAIATAYNWPDWKPTERTEVKVDPAVLARYVGTYELAPTFSITFTLEGDQLMTQATGQPKFPIYPESPTKFFLKVVDAEVEFFSDDKRQVSYIILHQGGQDHKGVRK